MTGSLDYLTHLQSDSERFARCLTDADPAARVPTCPEWTAADLLWHVTEVQLFWGAIVRDRLSEPDTAEDEKPDRPTDYAELLELYAAGTRQLLAALAATPDATPAWTWAEDQTVGFIRRRQAHEVLIHRLDAELTVGEVTAIDPLFAADGVDEILAVMLGGFPAWADYRPSGKTGRLVTTDTGGRWTCRSADGAGPAPIPGRPTTIRRSS